MCVCVCVCEHVHVCVCAWRAHVRVCAWRAHVHVCVCMCVIVKRYGGEVWRGGGGDVTKQRGG